MNIECLDDITHRPSSWPVRHQRRHVATIQFNNEVLSSLAQIITRMQCIEEKLGMLPLSLSTLPPGLENQEPDHRYDCKRDDSSIDAKLDAITALIEEKLEEQDSSDSRLARLETLMVCKPSVDEVLSAMLTAKSDKTLADSHIKSAHGSDSRSVALHVVEEEPEMETSPTKDKLVETNLTASTSCSHSVGSSCKHINFDIYDAGDLSNKSVQTEGPSNDEMLTATKINRADMCVLATQTKIRTIGRAVQTEPSTKTTSDVATDTDVDIADSKVSIENYLSGSQPDTNENVAIQPCILDQAFMNVLMSSMESKFDERLARLMRN